MAERGRRFLTPLWDFFLFVSVSVSVYLSHVCVCVLGNLV